MIMSKWRKMEIFFWRIIILIIVLNNNRKIINRKEKAKITF
jgi:hypothetical protein